MHPPAPSNLLVLFFSLSLLCVCVCVCVCVSIRYFTIFMWTHQFCSRYHFFFTLFSGLQFWNPLLDTIWTLAGFRAWNGLIGWLIELAHFLHFLTAIRASMLHFWIFYRAAPIYLFLGLFRYLRLLDRWIKGAFWPYKQQKVFIFLFQTSSTDTSLADLWINKNSRLIPENNFLSNFFSGSTRSEVSCPCAICLSAI